MNREIKFRIWNKIDKIMLQPENQADLLLFLNGGLFSRFDKEIENSENYIIQQFTGLKDKNDKEIYDGDIVTEIVERGPDCRNQDYILKDNEKFRIKQITWGKYGDEEYVDSIECWMFGDYDSLSELINQTTGKYHEWVRTYEVVGNIFENPELLKS